MTKKDKILEKLRKLMNLKESAKALGNYGEANAAAAGVTRLLMEYNLTEDDIPDQEKINNPVIAEQIPYRTKLEDGPWYRALASVVCQYNMAKCLIVFSRSNTRLQRTKIQIVGRQKNVEVVIYLISFLANVFVQQGRKNYPEYKHDCFWKLRRTPLPPGRYMRSFLVGCIAGLDDKFKEMQNNLEESKLTSLVLSTSKEIDDFLKDEKIGKVKESPKSPIDALCVRMGLDVGYNIEISKGINATVVDKERRLL